MLRVGDELFHADRETEKQEDARTDGRTDGRMVEQI